MRDKKVMFSVITIFLLFFFVNIVSSNNSSNIELEIYKNQLKAVLIVGPQEDGTAAAITKMDKIADFFRDKGVEVHCFYNDKTDWDKIVVASEGANFFVYSGHGGTSGGLNLSTHISNQQIVSDLKLHENAMIIFKSVCYGAGSSAGDDDDIGIKTALSRATNYAIPFFEIGIGCYYANNFGDGCLNFLELFFEGKTVQECYTAGVEDGWAKIEITENCSIANDLKISIASSDWGGTCTRITYTNGVKKVEEVPNPKSYDIAYISKPDFTIEILK